MQTNNLKGKKWYFRLNKGKDSLMKVVPMSTLCDSLIVQFVKKGKERDIRLYTSFSDHIEFKQYENKFEEKHRHFHEVIVGEYGQKPRFDIDMKKGSLKKISSIVNILIDNLMKCMSELGYQIVPSRDILMFTSHSSQRKGKKSVHIVVDNYFHSNHLEAKAFYSMVVSDMEEKTLKYIDHSVYSSLQNFRILGSSKCSNGENRTKIFCPKWFYYGIEIEYEFPPGVDQDLYILSRSLVTNTSSCKKVTGVKVEKKVKTTSIEYSDHDVKEIIDLLIAKCPELESKFDFRSWACNNTILNLDSVCEYNCPICFVEHENENPYISVYKGNCKFFCRRYKDHYGKKNSGLFLGYVEDKQIEKEITIQDKSGKPKKKRKTRVDEMKLQIKSTSCGYKTDHEKAVSYIDKMLA